MSKTGLAVLASLLAAGQAGIAQGKTLDQLKQEKVLAKWDSFGKGFISTDVFTEILYDNLSRKTTGPKDSHGHLSQ